MRRTRAFTLVELLVVIGIIAVLISILLPALGRAQRSAKITACLSNERQLALALIMYCQENQGYFPGGRGSGRFRDAQGNPGVNPDSFTLATYNPDAWNPYSCNGDESYGPTYLAKYVSKSEKIPYCPSDPMPPKRVGSFYTEDPANPTRLDPNTNWWTSYWYPQSLFFNPIDIWNGNVSGIAEQPQKLVKVKFPTQKVVIIDRKTFHVKVMVDTDKTFTGLNATKKPDAKEGLKVCAGFADGHAEYRSVYEMYDSDVNWTGRKNFSQPWTLQVPGRAGVLWKDFE